MKISAGPILYFWPQQKIRDFYEDLKSLPVDIVYLGETVCPKRREIEPDQWIEIARDLAASGKEVILSTLTLLEGRADLAQVKKMVNNGEFLVEANDIAGVELLIENDLPLITGPAINIYNHAALKVLHSRGLKRWVMPIELGHETLSNILQQANLGESLETEVFAGGKIPLAYSARCYTARAYNLPKDDCQLKCLEHPDGMTMVNQHDKKLFTLNGIQTLSGHYYNLAHDVDRMRSIGVDIVRISPEPEVFNRHVKLMHSAINNEPCTDKLIPSVDQCDGYWFGKPGMNNTTPDNLSSV